MKKIIILVVALSTLITVNAQYAYIPEFLGGILNYTDLTNPSNKVSVGTTVEGLGASDFGPLYKYYGLSANDNGFYEIDTSDASYTLIATVNPPSAGHFWTGMAYDPTSGILYVASTDGNSSDLFTINVSDGTLSLVGTNTDGDGIVAMSFDDEGQLYAYILTNSIYLIDKTNASGTLLGGTGFNYAGQWHGMDYCSENQTMYMTNYNSFTFDNELRTVDLTNGSTTMVGSVGVWAGSFGCEPTNILEASFTSDTTIVCDAGSVNFFDMSTGFVSSWQWYFEGGTPATSTDENPVISYNSLGCFNVKLVVNDGVNSDSITIEDYIHVQSSSLSQPDTPEGATETCQGLEFTYSTSPVTYASSYVWDVDPADAGSISGSGVNASFQASNTYTGAYSIKVKAENTCGESIWSDALSCTMQEAPDVYDLMGDGVYCEGSTGSELSLSGSETGIEYELYLDDEPTGNIVAGTGDPISFGFVTEEGIYTVYAITGDCYVLQSGNVWVHMEYLPLQAEVPQGPTEICNDTSSVYVVNEVEGADTLIWVIDPEDAGTLVPNELEVTVEWNMEFSGEALLSVYGENDCGAGPASNELPISVGAMPEPDISGLNLVCDEDEADYQTEEHSGNYYYWEVEGGTIMNGAGTHHITVLWGDPGAGVVRLTEESAEGCEASTEDFLVTIDECTSVHSINLDRIEIYPNPVNDKLYVHLNQNMETKTRLSLSDLMGRELINTMANGQNKLELDLENLDNGIYILSIETKNNRRVFKIEKSK